MKRLIALLLAAIMVLSLAACSTSKPEETTKATESTGDTKATDGSEATGDNEATGDTEATDGSEATDGTEATGDTEATENTTGAEATDPTEPPEPFVPEIGEGVFSKTSYTATDKDLETSGDLVVATVGEAELTLSELQVYYWMNVAAFLSNYSYYLSYFGLDITRPLDEQECPQIGGTWQQYFLMEALNSWHAYQSLALEGIAQNTPMNEDYQAELDSIDENLEKAATEGKYDSVDAMMKADLGPGVTKESYISYLTVYSTGLSYYEHTYNAIEVTDDMIEAYFAEHEEELKESDITKEKGKLVDVRHILVTPVGEGTGEETEYTEEEWAACEELAQDILDMWLEGEKTEESFAALANDFSADPGSNTNGGLYEDVATGDMVEEFDAWCFDESRKVGDHGLVKTTYGYHIMFYSGDEPLWIHECHEGVLSEKANEFITAAAEAHPLTVDYEKIMLGYSDLAATE